MGVLSGNAGSGIVFPLSGLALLAGVSVALIEGSIVPLLFVGAAIWVLFKSAQAINAR